VDSEMMVSDESLRDRITIQNEDIEINCLEQEEHLKHTWNLLPKTTETIVRNMNDGKRLKEVRSSGLCGKKGQFIELDGYIFLIIHSTHLSYVCVYVLEE